VHFLVAFNVYDGDAGGWCLDKNDHDHFCGGYAKSNGATPKLAHSFDRGQRALISRMTTNATSRAGRVRVLYTPPMLRGSISGVAVARVHREVLDRFDPESRQHLM